MRRLNSFSCLWVCELGRTEIRAARQEQALIDAAHASRHVRERVRTQLPSEAWLKGKPAAWTWAARSKSGQ